MTVLVTGANRGIGLELVRQLREQGREVIGTSRDLAQANDLYGIDGARVMQLDVTDDVSVANLAEDLKDEKIELLINNAGIGSLAPISITELDFDDMKMTFDVNSLGPMRVTRALLPNILASDAKKVVQMSSILGSIGFTRGGFYSYRASKAALNILNSSFATDLKDMGVTSIVMHPGWVETRIGGPGADITDRVSVAGMLYVIDGLVIEQTGQFIDYQGNNLPWQGQDKNEDYKQRYYYGNTRRSG